MLAAAAELAIIVRRVTDELDIGLLPDLKHI
jgi:hypothetical protein